MCDDKCDLASCHHSHADLQALIHIISHQLCGKTAADYLCDQPDSDKAQREQQQRACKAVKPCFQTYACKEHGSEYHIRIYIYFTGYVFRIVQIAKYKTCDIGSRNICDAEEPVGCKRKEHTHRKAEYRHTALVRVALVDELENIVHKYPHTYTARKEQQNISDHQYRFGIGLFESDNERQHDDTDNVVDYCGAGDERTDVLFDVSKLLERLNGDSHRCRSQYRSDEHCSEKAVRADCFKAVEAAVKQCTSAKRHEHSDYCDHKRFRSRFDKLLQVCLKTCAEHYHYHAYLGKQRNVVGLLHDAENTRTYQQACDYLAHDLRRFELLCDDAEHLCADDYYCKVLKKINAIQLNLPSFFDSSAKARIRPPMGTIFCTAGFCKNRRLDASQRAAFLFFTRRRKQRYTEAFCNTPHSPDRSLSRTYRVSRTATYPF